MTDRIPDAPRADAPSVRVERIIIVDFKRGKGVEGDPVRIITRYHTIDGDLLVEVDHWKEG